MPQLVSENGSYSHAHAVVTQSDVPKSVRTRHQLDKTSFFFNDEAKLFLCSGLKVKVDRYIKTDTTSTLTKYFYVAIIFALFPYIYI